MIELGTLAVLAAETGGAAEEVKNPILPVVSEMLWAGVFFLALWALMKFVLLPPIERVMDGRDEKVRQDRAAAEEARAARQRELEAYEASLAGVRAEATRLIEDARVEGESVRRSAVAEAEADVAARREAAAAEVAEAKAAARAQLAPAIAGIALDAAEAVLEKPLDRAAQTGVVEEYVNRAGSQN